MSLKRERCKWLNDDALYIQYHDEEWGRPVKDDTILFEFIVLESFQAGLSWFTILKKREAFREAFDDFDYHKIALYDAIKIASLLENAQIIRHKGKIQATISNAQAYLKIQQEFGSFSDFIWSYVDHQPIVNRPKSLKDIPSQTLLSQQIAKDLKKRGFKFMGPTTVYAFMQAVGLVDDHMESCWCSK